MKIGILTFWWSEDNYGQLLQCYALQKFLIDFGHDVFLIRYKPEKKKDTSVFRIIKIFNIKLLYNYVRVRIRKLLLRRENKHNRYFSSFMEKYINVSDKIYTTPEQIKDAYPEADAYIVGSDQVWNYTLYELYHTDIYFLNFGKTETLRLSYAASWGKAGVTGEIKRIIEPLIKNFKYVSVREKSGIEICNSLGVKKKYWVPDPTMLLDSKKYRSLYQENNVRKIEQPYLLLYMLNNTCDFNIKNVFEYAKIKKLTVIYVTGNGIIDKYHKFYATIPEWLSLIDNAEYVITNSFHCSVFSTIFNKQYGVIKLTGKWKESNSRFDSLFERFQIMERFITNDDFSVLDKIYDTKEISIPENFLESLK